MPVIKKVNRVVYLLIIIVQEAGDIEKTFKTKKSIIFHET